MRNNTRPRPSDNLQSEIHTHTYTDTRRADLRNSEEVGHVFIHVRV